MMHQRSKKEAEEGKERKEDMTIFLITLGFRTPPFQATFSNPNILEGTLITLDGVFSFAKYYANRDWRKRYLEDLTRAIADRTPSISTSYLMPSVREGDVLSVLTPYNTEMRFGLNRETACLESVREVKSHFGGAVRICISRKSMIPKILLVKETVGVKLRGSLSEIQETKGAYRDIFYEVRIERTNLLWTAVARGEKKDIENSLKAKMSIGKKRDMGWGDLKKTQIYNLISKDDISLDERGLVYKNGKSEYRELLRPHTTTEVISLLRNRKCSLLKSVLAHSATKPPYWRKELVVSLAKLVCTL